MNIYDYILGRIAYNSRIWVDELIYEFKSSETILNLSNDLLACFLSKIGVEETDIKTFLEEKTHFNENKKEVIGKINIEISNMKEAFNIDIISFSDFNYPPQLKKIKGIPLNLYVKGDINFNFSKSIAIVGARNATSYAKEKVVEISKELAKFGFCVISGLARGLDGQAQNSVVAVNGKTIAVLPFLSKKIYPPEHTQLATEILANGGALISENFYPDKVYDRFLFTQRNRIISGLSRAIFIAEGERKSGSLSQYNHAKRQNKLIFTLRPLTGHEGTYLPKKIIKEGGIEIESAKDIINFLSTFH